MAGQAAAETLVTTYSTYVGSLTATEESVNALTTDTASNLYVGGVTQFDADNPLETGFPTTPTSLHLPNSYTPDNPCEQRCGYVLKLDRDHQVVYGAILPFMNVRALAVGDDGAVYATGEYGPGGLSPPTVTPGAFSTDGSLFAIKLSPDGSELEYAAAFAGNEARAIAVDSLGNAYIAGEVAGNTLPTTPNAVKPAKDTSSFDAFLLKINPTGMAVVFGTYLGGSQYDGAYGVALDGAGGAVVAGRSSSSDFVGFPFAAAGPGEAFVVRVAADGSAIVAAKPFGGSGDDLAAAISSDGQGGYLLAGSTTSSDFPVTAGVIQSRLLGERNGWLARVDADLTTRYSTFFGGSFVDGLLAVTSGPGGIAYVVGTTFSADMLTTSDGFQDASAVYSTALLAGLGTQFYPRSDAIREAFLASLSADGAQVLYGTYFGGHFTVPRNNLSLTFGSAVARGPDGVVAVGGSTLVASFPVASGGLRDTLGGRLDGFLVRLAPQEFAVTSPSLLPWADEGYPYQYQLTAAGTPPYDWELVGFKLPDGLVLTADGRISGTPGAQSEFRGYQFTARATDAAGRTAHKSLFLNMEYDGNATCVPTSCTLDLVVSQPFIFQLPYLARAVPPFLLFTSGDLPPGTSVDLTSGSFGGNPTTAGVYNFAFTVRDTLNQSGTVSWRVTVTGQSQAPPPAPGPSPAPTPPPAVPAPTSSGGGGALSANELALLFSFALIAQLGRRGRQAQRGAGQRRGEGLVSDRLSGNGRTH